MQFWAFQQNPELDSLIIGMQNLGWCALCLFFISIYEFNKTRLFHMHWKVSHIGVSLHVSMHIVLRFFFRKVKNYFKTRTQLLFHRGIHEEKHFELLYIGLKLNFGFPVVNFPWLTGDVPRLQSTLFIFCSWFDLLDVVLTFLIFILKTFRLLRNYTGL